MGLDLERWSLLKKHLYKIYPYKCMKCRKSNCEMHADHVLPKSKHSSHTYKLDNLQVLCKECNLEKSNKSKADYRSKKHLKKMARYINDNMDYLIENKFITKNMITKKVRNELKRINKKYHRYLLNISDKRRLKIRLNKLNKSKQRKEIIKPINISTSKNKDGSTKTILRKKSLL